MIASGGFAVPLNGLAFLVLFVLMAASFAVGWMGRSERQRRLEALREEHRRLRTEEHGRFTPRHPSTIGNARISRASIYSQTGDHED